MIVPNKKVSFVKIGTLLKSIDATSGAFVFWSSSEKTTIKEKIFKLTMPRLLLLTTFLIISTLIVTDFSLISIIFCCAMASFIFSVNVALMNYIYNKKIIKGCLKWCESLYDVKKKYHELIQNMAETKLVEIESQSTKFLKWLRIIFYIDALCFTIGFTIVGLFLPESIYPKFSAPIPFYLPFQDQKTWLAFICTTIFETFIWIDIASIAIFLFGFSFEIFIHILGYLDIIEQATEKMKQEVILNTKTDEVTNKFIKPPTLKIQTLADVDASLMKSQNNSFSFDIWIKLLNDMICDVNFVMSTARDFYAFPFLLTELTALGSLFICGLLITVVHEKYFFAIGVTLVSWLLLVYCILNEKILEKFDRIKKILYDIPWYYLTVKERKSLMLLMNCDKIQKGLTASGIHPLTYNRFGIIVKVGYTNFLVLKDLVQK